MTKELQRESRLGPPVRRYDGELFWRPGEGFEVNKGLDCALFNDISHRVAQRLALLSPRSEVINFDYFNEIEIFVPGRIVFEI